MNVSTICRVCLKKSKGLKISIFQNADDNKQLIVNKIMQCADVKITYEKNAPDKICEKCLKNLNTAYNFRELCKRTENSLKILMNQNNRDNVIISLNNGKTYKLPKDIKLKIIKDEKTNENVQNNFSDNEESNCEISQNNRKKQTFAKRISSQNSLSAVQRKERDSKESSIKTFNTLMNEDDWKENVEIENIESGDSNDGFKEDSIDNVNIEKTNSLDADGDDIIDGTDNNLDKKVRNVHLKVNNVDQNKFFICEICCNSYKKECILKTHIKRHHNEKSCPCEICGRLFLNNSLMARHLIRHTGHKPYKCSCCSRKFYEKAACKEHERTHNGERPYICKICNKSFVYSQGLSKHMLIHEQIKLYNCEICNKEFRLKHHLKQHEQTLIHQEALDKHKILVKNQ